MALFAIADVHLSLGTDKPMDVFGTAWENHVERLEAAWKEVVSEEDVVLLPGDISWAMDFSELLPDLKFLEGLPGMKILGRGNHDYWWSTHSRMRKFVESEGFDSFLFMKNNAFSHDGDVIGGSRGWLLPWDTAFTAMDAKVLEREKGRLRMSLDEMKKIGLQSDTEPARRIAAMHYPPTDQRFRLSPYTDIMDEYSIDICVYGHLHGIGARYGPDGTNSTGIRFVNASADRLSFRPVRI